MASNAGRDAGMSFLAARWARYFELVIGLARNFITELLIRLGLEVSAPLAGEREGNPGVVPVLPRPVQRLLSAASRTTSPWLRPLNPTVHVVWQLARLRGHTHGVS